MPAATRPFSSLGARLSAAVIDLNLGLAVDAAADSRANEVASHQDAESLVVMMEALLAGQEGLKDQVAHGQSDILAELQGLRDAVAGLRVANASRAVAGAGRAPPALFPPAMALVKRIRKADVAIEDALGSGSFGDVFRASYLGSKTKVAVKKLRAMEAEAQAYEAGGADTVTEAVMAEASLQATIHDPTGCCLRLLGVVAADGGDPPWLVLEFCRHGSLASLLAQRRLDTRGPLPLGVAIEIVRQLALGLIALHDTSPAIVHADLKLDNCLVFAIEYSSGGGEVTSVAIRISDFGLARVKRSSSSVGATKNGVGAGTLTHMAPEVIDRDYVMLPDVAPWEAGVSPASDVYALGILIFEIVTGQVPYAGLTDPQIVRKVVDKRGRPELPPTGLPPAVIELITDCWSPRPASRPTARQVLARLDDFSAKNPTLARVLSAQTRPSPNPAPAANLESLRAEMAALETRAVAAEAEARAAKATEANPPPPSPPQGQKVAPEPPSAPAVAAYDVDVSPGQSLQSAVDGARPGATILLQPGVHLGPLHLTKDVTIVGRGAATIAVDGGGSFTPDRKFDYASTVSCVESTAAEATLNGLILRRGAGGKGCGLLVSAGAVKVVQCDVSSLSMDGVAVRGASTSPRFVECVVHDGSDTGFYFFAGAKGRLERCTVRKNRLSGLIIRAGADPTLLDCKLLDGHDAGISVFENGLGTVLRCTVSGHGKPGFHIKSGGNPQVRECTISNGKGSGVYVLEDGLGVFERCSIFGHTLSNVVTRSGGNPHLADCKLHSGSDGGFYAYEGGKGHVERCDIYGNSKGVVVMPGCGANVHDNKIHDNATRNAAPAQATIGRPAASPGCCAVA